MHILLDFPVFRLQRAVAFDLCRSPLLYVRIIHLISVRVNAQNIQLLSVMFVHNVHLISGDFL